MDPVSWSLGVVVAAMVKKAAEKVAEQAADGGVSALGRLVAAVRKRFVDEGDAAGSKALARVEDLPVGEQQLGVLAEAVDRQVAADAGFGVELEGLVKAVEVGGVDVVSVVQSAWGSQIAQVANVKDSTVTISYGTTPPKT